METSREKKNARNRLNYQKNKEKLKELREKNKEKKDEYNKQYYEKNKEKLKNHNKEYYVDNKDIIIENSSSNYYKNKKHYRQKNKEYCEKNRDSVRKKRIEWYNKNKSKVRDSKYKNKYGITIEEYNKLLLDQQDKCKICGVHKNDLNINLVIDHSHVDGSIRGLLCGKCNSILGFANDDIKIFEKAIEYLSKTNRVH